MFLGWEWFLVWKGSEHKKFPGHDNWKPPPMDTSALKEAGIASEGPKEVFAKSVQNTPSLKLFK